MPQARITILGVHQDSAEAVGQVVYLVRLDCCRRAIAMTHDAIGRRKTDARRAELEGRELRCLRCGRIHRDEHGQRPVKPKRAYQPQVAQDYGVTPPEWPRPGAGGYWLWGDPR